MSKVIISLPKTHAHGQIDPSLKKFFNVQLDSRANSGATRGEDTALQEESEVNDDDVLAVEYSNGIQLWMRADDYPHIHKSLPSKLSRGAVSDWVAEAVHRFTLTPLDSAAEAAGTLGALEIIKQFEKKLNPGPGLYQVSRDIKPLEQILSPGKIDRAGPILLLLHGTASNTEGSFSGLSLAGKTILSLNNTLEWQQLSRTYRNRILALEHRTLSQSPIDNACELAELLPDNLTLDIVSHSRGGLVGELLCLDQELSGDQLKAFSERNRQPEAEQLKDLSKLLKRKNLNVRRFVRVACPARGTILVSDRLDIYLSIILNLARLIPGFEGNPFFEFFKAAAIHLIKSRAKPDMVPGVEAMMPQSPLINILNLNKPQTKGQLAVIAGDQQGDTLLGKLRDFVTDLYYWENHDLVVNTESMYRGAGRETKPLYFFDVGAGVNHFQYFDNYRTRELLTNFLCFPEKNPQDYGFKELTEANLTLEKTAKRGALPEDAPIVFFIPGFMGTHLHDADGPVWLHREALALNGASRLPKANQPGQLLGPPYQTLVNFLQQSVNVVEFPYDWKKSALDNAAALSATIEKELQQPARVVHLMSHSSGNLLVNAIPDDVWQKINERNGNWVELGGMRDGTYFAVLSIIGEAPIIRALDMLDVSGQPRMARIFQSWPGLLEQLPERFLEANAWQGLTAKPDEQSLARARQVRNRLQRNRQSCYVTGNLAPTPGFDEASSQIVHRRAGDGRILREDLPKANIWWVDAAHGDLANQPQSFRGLLELLLKGDTNQLPKGAPFESLAVAPPMRPNLFPQESDLIKAALGGQQASPISADIATIKLSVLHGDLSKTSNPVLVGHYVSDSLVSAEKRLDFLLADALSRRFVSDVYPGQIGTSEIIRLPDRNPPGAIVVGLGSVGKLTEDLLRSTARQAILRYALALAESPNAGGSWQSAAFSSLLVGTYGGESIDVLASVTAIVRAAVDANRLLRQQKLWDRVRVDAVQFVEIYEDLAISAIHAVNHVNDVLRHTLNSDERIEAAAFLEAAEGGRDRRPVDQYSAGWWRRIEVTDTLDGNGLKFKVLTDRARSEESTSAIRAKRVDSFVQKVIGTPQFDGRSAVTLYELLMPKTIKQSNDTANLVLEVDDSSAQYPWEMLARRSGALVSPFAIEAGFIRQFRASSFETPRNVMRSRSAIIAAMPNPGSLPELAGAAAEAAEIRRHLEEAGYAIEPGNAIAENKTDDIITALFTTDYRILHFAGHGQIDGEKRVRLLLGENDFLTADDVKNLPSTPDLVFLNCCHAGKIDPQVNKLAASISRAFIDIGCRAVVAAGWAIDDSAALKFAREFYRHMLAGETFGHAVLEARKLVRRDHSDKNTWGAYQCYGNPDYRLQLRGKTQFAARSYPPRSRTEFMQSCRNLMEDSNAGSQSIQDLFHQVPPAWQDGELLSVFADAFQRRGEFETAVEFYDKAIHHPGATAPFYAVQKLANFLDRLAKSLNFQAAKIAETDPPGSAQLKDKAAKRADQAVKWLEWLNQQLGPTTERLSMLGGAYRRKALFADSANALKSLKKARDYYREAHEIAKDNGQIDPYPALNWLSLRYFIGESPSAIEPDLAVVLQAALDQAKKRTDFWSQIGRQDAELTAALIRGTLPKLKEPLSQAYVSILSDTTNEAHFESVCGGINDTRDLAKGKEDVRAALSFIASEMNKTRKGKTVGTTSAPQSRGASA